MYDFSIWQIGASFNCNNPSFCGPNLGGGWGWIEFDQGGTGDATFADCTHMLGGGFAGAQAVHIDITGWKIGEGSAGANTFIITSAIITLVGHTGGPPQTMVSNDEMDLGIPAMAGHYNTSMIIGMAPPPGVAIQIQVVQIPNRQ